MQKQSSRWSMPFEQRLGAYAFAAGAALASSAVAKAEIIYTYVDLKVAHVVDIDLNHDGINDFQVEDFTGSQQGGGREAVLALANTGNGFAAGQFGSIKALNKGDTIGSNPQFVPYGYMAFVSESPMGGGAGGDFLGTTGKYLGLRFVLNGDTFFGWARVDIPNMRGFGTTLVDYAYDNVANEPIAAGNTGVPEPGTLGLLALGAAGMALWRKKSISPGPAA